MAREVTPTEIPAIIWSDPYQGSYDVSYLLLKEWVDPVRAQFEALADAWEEHTGHLSPSRSTSHGTFEAMKRLGNEIIPWAVGRVQRKSSWSLLLNQLVTNPPDIQAEGDTDKLKAGWSEWEQEWSLRRANLSLR